MKNCKIKLPVGALILEVVILIGMFVITGLFSFSLLGVTLSYVFYEAVRVLVVVNNGKREGDFAKQYIIAVAAMVLFYVITMFLALIYMAVSNKY